MLEQSKFGGFTDEELEMTSEAFGVCYQEGIGPDNDTALEKAIVSELVERGLEIPWWADSIGEE